MCTVHLDGILKYKICVILLHYTDKINHTYRFEMSTFFASLLKTLLIVGEPIYIKKSKLFLLVICYNHDFVFNITRTLE